MKIRVCILIAGLLAVAAKDVAAAPVTGACTPTRVNYSASSIDGSSNNSTTYANIPEASVTFSIGAGNAPSCVIVRFSAVTRANGTSNLELRALLNNTPNALPVNVTYATGAATAETHLFEFIFHNVVAGSHTVKMQFRKGSSAGGSVFVDRHNLVVQHH